MKCSDLSSFPNTMDSARGNTLPKKVCDNVTIWGIMNRASREQSQNVLGSQYNTLLSALWQNSFMSGHSHQVKITGQNYRKRVSGITVMWSIHIFTYTNSNISIVVPRSVLSTVHDSPGCLIPFHQSGDRCINKITVLTQCLQQFRVNLVWPSRLIEYRYSNC